jgi:hypothetical protein
MARIVVQADDQRTVLLDERDVKPAHLSDEHSAEQLLERVGWAIRDEDRRVRGRGPRAASPVTRHESALTRTFE